ncbi:Beta-N-acetylhexosaminidase [Aphelenchoides besseyi]|nr:Beta-N-acetylhexosaminidase [Aphelenchoides besseyi]
MTSRVYLTIIVLTIGFFTVLSFVMQTDEMINETRSQLDGSAPKIKIMIHFDLKGAPPRIDYYEPLFRMFNALGIDSILVEYEDTFPYSGPLTDVTISDAYSVDNIRLLNDLSQKYNLKLVPLVQTFGHMEFVLKQKKFSHLSENMFALDSICPSDPQSLVLIEELVKQIRDLHPFSHAIHLGADEAYHVAEDQRCRDALVSKFHNLTDNLKLNHISNIAQIARKYNFSDVYVWNDMFEHMTAEQMKQFKLDELVIPVVWGYKVDVTEPGYFPDGMFEQYGKTFNELVFGSAFKGANGINSTFIEINRYLANLQSYHKLYLKFHQYLSGKVNQIVLTGWQRYKHEAPLCELLPDGIPTLVEQVFYIRNWFMKSPTLNQTEVEEFLDCRPTDMNDINFEYKGQVYVFHPSVEWRFLNCTFPGVEIYRLIEKDLRLTLWKWAITRDTTELSVLRPKLESELSKVYGSRTVNEWLRQNVDLIIQTTRFNNEISETQ